METFWAASSSATKRIMRRCARISRIAGPVLGPFESISDHARHQDTGAAFRTRQCENACKVASWLKSHPDVDRVNYPADPAHPDAADIKRLFSHRASLARLSALKSRDADKPGVMAFMDRLKMIVPGTSLGDVHTLLSIPGNGLAPRCVRPKCASAWAFARTWCACPRHRSGRGHHSRSGPGA